MDYVILPNIKYLEIENFQLYKNGNFKWDFNDGMNLFLGVNGLGKTTTIKTLAYAIIGLSKDEKENINNTDLRNKDGIDSKTEEKEFIEIKNVGIINENYFKRYETNNEISYVKVEFYLSEKLFSIKRNLLTHKIEYLKIDKDSISGDLDELYKEYFEKFSGINLINFRKILYTLLIRTEEAPSLLFRPTIQNIVLRTLLFKKEFHVEFLNIEKKLRALESDYRHSKYELDKLKKTIKEKNDKSEELFKEIDELYLKLSDNSKDEKEKIEVLEKKESKLREEESKLKEELNKAIDQINSKSDLLKDLAIKKGEYEYKLQEKEDEIISLKKKVYSQIYSDDDIYTLALNSITERRSCIFCNSKIDEKKVDRIIESMNKSECCFCNSKIIENIDEENCSSQNVVDLNNELVKEKKSLSNNLLKITQEIEKLNLEIVDMNNKNNNRIKNISNINSEIEMIKNLINNAKFNKMNTADNSINEKIANKKREVNELKASIEIDKKNYNKSSIEIFGKVVDFDNNEDQLKNNDIRNSKGIVQQLLQIREKYEVVKEKANRNIENIEEKLMEKFNKYNILNNFSLHKITTKNIEKNLSIIKYSMFVPKNITETNNIDDGNIRSSEDMLSKSEQVLLDYSFRLALIETYIEISGNRSFIAFETSEGVLDAIHILKFGEMLNKYSKHHKIICISNLHDEEFIKNMFEKNLKIDEKLNSTLNFITMSSKNIDDINFYKDMWKNIFGKEF